MGAVNEELIKLRDGVLIPSRCFDSEETLFGWLLDRAIRKAHIRQMLEVRNEIRIKEVIFSGPATIVFWDDGTKTVVKCSKGDHMDYEIGIAMCTLKKLLGESYPYYKKHTEKLAKEKKEAEMKKKLHGYVEEIKEIIKENKKAEGENEQET